MRTLFDLEPLPDTGLKVNDAQRRAITHAEGPLLVIAGAGTGKTRVITERIRHLLQSDPNLSGENILGLTFTDKAAGEMKARVVKTVGERGKDVTLKTFHAFCESILKDSDPKSRMLDKVDHWILLRRNLSRLKLDRYRRLAEPGQFLNDFVEFFSRCQDELVSCEGYQRYVDELTAQLQAERNELDADTLAEREEAVAREQEIARAYRASEELLREKKCSSFGTLITGAVAVLERDAHLRTTLQNRYRYILVDEFQDTNIAQLRLLELLVNASKNIFAVGDNDQAIYRFRGASFGSFKLFLERFANWREGQDSTKFRVSLTENYRSTPNILRVATQVIGQNTVSADFPKKVLSANKPEGEKIRVVELAAPEDEARWLAGELERIHKAGRRWRDFAILYRAHTHRDELVRELSRRRIPFVISRLSILEHPLVKDILGYLRLIATPYDDIATARVLAAPAWQLAPADLVRFAERARKERVRSYDALFPRAFREAHQIRRGQLPGGRGEHARRGNVVVRRGDQPKVSEDVLDQRMLQNREPRNHERNPAPRKLAHQFVAMGVRAIQNGEIAPAPAGLVDALQFSGQPARLVLGSGQFHNANLFAFRLVRAQHFLGEIGAHRVLPNDLRGYAQNIRGGAVIFRQAHPEFRGVLSFAPVGKAFEKELEAAEGGAAEAVDGLVVVAHGENIFRGVDQQFQQPQLRDVGVLKFVNQDVAIAVLQRGAQMGVALEHRHRAGDQRAERRALFLAQQFLAGAVGARDLLFAGHGFLAFGERVRVEPRALRLQLRGEFVGVMLVSLAGNQLVLAARKKLHEIVQELAGLGQAPVAIELQARKIAPQQNPMIDFIEHAALRIGILQQRFAERVECFEGHVLGALADASNHASFHLAGGLVGEGQAENIFAGKRGVGLQQVADTFDNDARFPGARAGNHQERSVAVGDGAPLRVIQLQASVGQRLQI